MPLLSMLDENISIVMVADFVSRNETIPSGEEEEWDWKWL